MDSSLTLLQKILRKEMNDLADAIALGACTDFAHYRNMVGRLEGLGMAERELLDLASRLNQDDDD